MCHHGTGKLLRVPTWRQVHRGCHRRLFLLEFQGAFWWGRGHRRGTTKRSGWAPTQLLVVARSRFWGGLGLAQSLIIRPRNCARRAMPAAVALLGPAPRPPRQGRSPDTAHRSCWRARPSKDQCQPSVLFACVFCRAHLHRYVALDGLGHDARRDWQFVCRAGRRPRGHTSCFQFPVCLRLCACVCVRLCSACMFSCVLYPLRALGSSARSRGAAGLLSCGKRIKLRYKTFHSLTWEVIRVDQTPPKLRAKGAETRHMVPCGFELAMDFHKDQQSAHSLTHRGLFEQPLGLHMTMALEPFDCAACARCSRRFCNLHKASSKGGLQRQLVGAEAEDAQWPRRCVRCSPSCYPREYWTCRDESFMGVVLSMAHSRGGSATASTIPLRVLDTHHTLSRL